MSKGFTSGQREFWENLKAGRASIESRTQLGGSRVSGLLTFNLELTFDSTLKREDCYSFFYNMSRELIKAESDIEELRAELSRERARFREYSRSRPEA